MEQMRAAVRDLRGELALISERLEGYETSRQRWLRTMEAAECSSPAAFGPEEYELLVAQAIGATCGTEIGQVLGTMTLAAAEDRAALWARVEALEAHNREITRQNAELVALIRTTAKSVATLFGMVDDRLVDPADSVPADIVEVRVGVDRVD
jgi:hypothetical protein